MSNISSIMLVVLISCGIYVLNQHYALELKLVSDASEEYATQSFYLGCMRSGAPKPVCWELTGKFKRNELR